MKRIVSVLLVSAIFLSLAFSGCGTAKEPDASKPSDSPTASGETAASPASNFNAPGTLPIAKEKVTLTAYCVQAPNVSDIINNETTKELEKRTNIKLDIIAVPLAQDTEKKKLMLSSGDLPDIFTAGMFSDADVMLYGPSQEVFGDITALVEQYAPNIMNLANTLQAFKDALYCPDGKIYGIPNINQCYHCTYPRKMYINQDWLTKLGLQVPETTDDWYAVLKAFKENDPNGNGKNDEIPLTGCDTNGWYNEVQHWFMNGFVYNDGQNYFDVQDGKLGFVASRPEWKQGLEYMNKLYKEKLIDPAAFTQNNDQLKQLGNKPDAVLLGAVPSGGKFMFIDNNTDPLLERQKSYVNVAPVKGPSGAQFTPVYDAMTGAHLVVTSACTDPVKKEAAVRLFDYIMSEEGTLLMMEGPEGMMWKQADAGQLDLMGRQAKWQHIVNTDQTQNITWGWYSGSAMLSEATGYRGFWAANQDPDARDGVEKQLFDATQKFMEPYAPAEHYTSVKLSKEEIEESFQYQTNIEKYVEESMVRFITGNLDTGKDWDTYVKKLDEMGLQKYMEIYSKAWDLKK